VEAPKACKTVYGYITQDVSGGVVIEMWDRGGVYNIHNYSLQLLNSIFYPSGGNVNFKIDVKKWDYTDYGSPSSSPYRIYRKVGNRSLYISHEVEGKLINYSYNLNIKSSLDYWNLRIASIYILSSQASIGDQTTVDTFKQVVGTNLIDLPSREQGSQGTLVVARQILLNGKEYEKTDYDYDMKVWAVKSEKHYRNNSLIYQYDSTYDTWGNLTSRTDTSRNINETWNYRDHSTVKNLVASETTTYNYLTDKEKKVITNNEYHATLAGKLTRQTVQADGKTLITDYTYDPDYGNVLTMTKFPDTDQELKTLYTYDAGKNFPVQITLKAIKDADGKTADINTYYQFDYDTGLKISETDARGYVTSYKYDELNRLIKAVLPDDANSPEGNRPYREYLFDDPNNRCDYYNEKRQHTRFEFDTLGRITGIIKYTKGDPYPAEVKTTYKYDTLGRIASVTDPRGNSDPTVVAKYTTWYEYDALNRVTQVTFPDETPADLSDNPYATLSYDDSANTVTIVDENRKGKTVERKNWLGQLVEAQQYCEFNGVTDTYKWQYAYDSLGGKVKETGPDGYTVAREYDSLGKLTKATFPSATLVLPNGKTPVEHQLKVKQHSPKRILIVIIKRVWNLLNLIQKLHTVLLVINMQVI
jgi:YD repeat-containing protein